MNAGENSGPGTGGAMPGDHGGKPYGGGADAARALPHKSDIVRLHAHERSRAATNLAAKMIKSMQPLLHAIPAKAKGYSKSLGSVRARGLKCVVEGS